MKIKVLPSDLKIQFKDKRLEMAVRIALSTALRISELLSLKIEDITYWEGDKLRVKSVIKVKVKNTSKKVQNRYEEVYLPVKLREAILDYIVNFLGRTEGYLFSAHRHGKIPMSRKTLWRLWKDCLKENGVKENYRFHDLRHTAISDFYRQCKDIVETAMFARHKKIDITREYTHINFEELKSEIEKFNGKVWERMTQ